MMYFLNLGVVYFVLTYIRKLSDHYSVAEYNPESDFIMSFVTMMIAIAFASYGIPFGIVK